MESKRCKDYKHNDQISPVGFVELQFLKPTVKSVFEKIRERWRILENYY